MKSKQVRNKKSKATSQDHTGHYKVLGTGLCYEDSGP